MNDGPPKLNTPSRGHLRGRGSGFNPSNRFETVHLQLLPERYDLVNETRADGVTVTTKVFSDRTATVINRVDSPDLPFNWTINPYRGCEHGCIYCYARPGHEYLGLSCGLDFETTIIAKHRAAELLERELEAPVLEGRTDRDVRVTDPYQPSSRHSGSRSCLS